MKKILVGLLFLFTASIHGQGLIERVFLQTDKQLYLAGELIYLKVFTVTPEKLPLTFSKIVYVELLDESNSRVQIKIELNNGIGESWMELPLDLPTGHYRLTAYTRYMLNEGASVFFEKNIGVVNTFRPNQIRKTQIAVSPKEPETPNRPTCSLQLNKTLYTNRDQGILKLDGLPEHVHTLSVSIAGKTNVIVDGTSDIRQWGISPGDRKDTSPRKYLPEYEGHIITGKIVPLQSTPGNTVDKTVIPFLSFPGEKLYLFEGQTNDLNNVSFFATSMAGIKEVSTTAYNTTENKYRVDLLSPFIEQHAKKELPALNVDSSHLSNLLKRSVALQALYSYTKDSLVRDRPGNIRFTMNPSQTYILDEWTRFVVMGELVIEFISELRFRRNDQHIRELLMLVLRGGYFVWERPLVVLDGIPVFDSEIIYRYNPLLVERINIYKDEYVFQGIKFDGIVEFLTYERNYPTLTTNQSTQIINYAGTQAPRHLYSPDYSIEKNRQSRLPDYRHTLLWEPALQTKGKSSIEVPFYTSDFSGEFLVTVEGLTKEGKIIFGETSFEVR